MRLYISRITNSPGCPTLDFKKPVAAGMFWETRELVCSVCDLIAYQGINIRHPYRGGQWPCTDFRIEPHPVGGFAISCEMPEFVS
jgi:hypothetical protein